MCWGAAGGGPGGTRNGGGCGGRGGDGPGGALGCFWRYGAILGSVLRCQKVAISLVSEGVLICHVFFMFFHRYLDAMLFS